MTRYYFGIHKASSTWLINILNDVSKYMCYNHKHYHSRKIFNHNINKEVIEKRLDFLSFTNADFETVKTINTPYKGFHVIRDIRDIIVSSYFSHKNTHSDFMWPEINEYRKELINLNKEEGIIATMSHLDCMYIDKEPVRIFDCLRNWDYENENILEIKFEDITKYPYTIVPEIFNFLDLLEDNDLLKLLISRFKHKFSNSKNDKIQLNTLLYFIYKHDFYFKSKGRKKGITNDSSHYRKGESGDWRNHLTDKHVKLIKEKYGDILIKTKYEKNQDWKL